MLAHSSAKIFYIEQLTVKSSIQWYHMTLIWRHLVLAVITGLHLFHVPAFFVEWAFVFSYTVACSCNIIFWGIDYLFVMRINYVFHVGHAAVAYFNVTFIEQLVKFVASREVLLWPEKTPYLDTFHAVF